MTSHAKGWVKCVLQTAVFVWGAMLVILAITEVCTLYQTKHPFLGTGLLGTLITLLVGSLVYAVEYSETRRLERLGYSRR